MTLFSSTGSVWGYVLTQSILERDVQAARVPDSGSRRDSWINTYVSKLTSVASPAPPMISSTASGPVVSRTTSAPQTTGRTAVEPKNDTAEALEGRQKSGDAHFAGGWLHNPPLELCEALVLLRFCPFFCPPRFKVSAAHDYHKWGICLPILLLCLCLHLMFTSATFVKPLLQCLSSSVFIITSARCQ